MGVQNRIHKFFYVLFVAVLVAVLALGIGSTSKALASGTVVVKPSAMNGWGFVLETGATGAGNFVTGPAPAPLGIGSAHFTTAAAADGIMVGAAGYGGTKLSDITALQYSTYQSLASTSTVQVVSLQFNVDNDVTDGDSGWKGRLVFEPYYTEAVVNGSWQIWNPMTQGKWWGTHASISGTCSIATPCTWSDVLTNFPNVGIHSVFGAVLLKTGSGWPAGFDGNADALTIGVSADDTTYDFEPETQCTTDCYVDAVNGDDSFGGDTPASAKKTIQAGINAVSPTGTVHVAAGTYDENVVITKSLILEGAGQGSTIVRPASSAPNPCAGSSLCGGLASSVFLVQADNVTIHDLTVDGDNPGLTSGIVRDGADLDARNGIITDYIAGTFNDLEAHHVTVQNIYLRGLYAASGGTFNFHHNTVTNVQGEANSIAMFNFGGSGIFESNTVSYANDAIASNWSTGTQYLNNVVTNSGSGVHTDNNGGFGGSADLLKGNSVSDCTPGGYGVWVFAPYVGPTVTENTVTNCEVGLAASRRSDDANPPVITSFTNNTVDGMSATGSVGVYVTTDGFGWGSTGVNASFTGNVIQNVETGFYLEAQTGYTLGVTATNNSIGGGMTTTGTGTFNVDASGNWWSSDDAATVKAAANGGAVVDYTPWLDVGTDTSGDPGFQGDFSTLNVDDDSPQTGTEGRVQEGVNLVSGSTVNVYPGTYSETAPDSYLFDGAGPYTFGIFVPDDQSGTTIRGVDSGGTPITDYASVLATINTNATNGFGPSGIFVEGDDVTIQGLRIGTNSAGQNKTIEVIGDNFTLKYSDIADLQGSVYLNDWRFDVGSDTSHVQSYRIEGNNFQDGISLDLASGAGYSGAVGGRVIKDNDFTNSYNWPSISFNGSGTGVPWFVYSVGGATIEGNTFTNTYNTPDNTSAHIRARGAYDNSQFDWTAYWNDNTFNKSAVALIGAYPPFDVRAYSYTSSSYTFNDVRRIGVTIQGEVNHATAGDTVLVNEGAYAEQVTVNKTLDLVGEDGALLTFIQAPSTLTGDLAIVAMTGAGVSVEMSGFTVVGPGPSGCGSINYGILVRDDAYANIHDNRILDIRDNPIGGCQNGIAILVGRVSLGTNGSADITNNEIAGYQKGGIVVSNAASSATITGNTVTGAGPVAFIAQNGIQVSGGATADIVGNTVSGHSYTPFTYVSTGMLLWGAGPTNTSGNIVSENQVGIYVIDTPGSHDGNTVSASSAGTGSPGFWGIVVDSPPPAHQPSPLEDGAAPGPRAQLPSVNSLTVNPVQIVTVTNNVLTGDSTAAGIGLEADSGFGSFDIDLTATNNYIQNWGIGVEIFECGAPYLCTGTTFANLNVNLNSITGNLTGYDHTNPTFTADGEKNWWGDAFGPSGTGPGSGDSVSANVDFDPWLCDGVDTDPAIGFQPNLAYVCSGPLPAIAIEKEGPVIATRGGPVPYNYQATNPGNVPLSAIAVTDNRCNPVAYVSGDTNGDNRLDAGETWLYTCTYTPASTFPKPLTNLGTATGWFQAQRVEDADDFTLYPFVLRKKIFLYWNGRSITYAQPDNTPFTVEVYKNNVLVGTYAISQSAPQKLWLSAGSYKFKEVNLPPGYLAGYSSIYYTTGQGYPDWTYPNVITSDLAIDKTGPTTAKKGNTITYNYTVTNAGPAAVKPKVTDNKCKPVTYVSGDTDNDGRVDPGETWTFQCKYKVKANPGATITNKATVKDAQRPSRGWFLGGDRNSSNNSDSWTVLVVP